MIISVIITQLLLIALYIFIIGIVGFLVGRCIPKRKLDHTKFPYRLYGFENGGKLYRKLKIDGWQAWVPDMSKLTKKIMPEKRLDARPDLEQVLLMIRETCMAELIHVILAFLGLLIPVICPGILGWLVAIAYIVFGNLPYVIIQRYNRPRLVALYESCKRSKLKNPTNVMIMSANTGGGHNAVARVIRDYYEEQGYSVDIVDALRFKSDEYSRFIAGVHNFVYNHVAWLYGMGWSIVEHSRSFHFGEYSLNRLGFKASNKELYRCIIDNGYTTVICTHVFAAIMIGDTARKYNLLIKTGRVETDYTNSPGAEYGFVDHHFVPSYMMIPQMLGRGADRESVVVSGIPIRKEACIIGDKDEAKAALGVPPDKAHILIMFGTEGNGPIEDIVRRLREGLDNPAYISVVCGRNEKLCSRLSEKYGNETDIKIYGFVTNVPQIMDSTDIFIGKPGGISITEAAARKLALLLVMTVGGCEKNNRDFFVNHGAALSVSAVNYIAKECDMLISDKELRDEICEATGKLTRSDSARIIFETMNGCKEPDTVSEV